MVKQRQEEGVAYKNIALSRIKLTNSLDAALEEGRQDEADILREKLAKVRVPPSQTELGGGWNRAIVWEGGGGDAR